MKKINYKELYNYCAVHLITKKKYKEDMIFNQIIKNLEKKIKNALIDNKTYIILYDNDYNENVNSILPKLKKHVVPFKITYREKTNYELTFIENMCEPRPYILIIDWIDYYYVSLNIKFYNLINKYIDHKKNLIESDNIILKIEDNCDTDDTNDSNHSFDLLNNI